MGVQQRRELGATDPAADEDLLRRTVPGKRLGMHGHYLCPCPGETSAVGCGGKKRGSILLDPPITEYAMSIRIKYGTEDAVRSTWVARKSDGEGKGGTDCENTGG